MLLAPNGKLPSRSFRGANLAARALSWGAWDRGASGTQVHKSRDQRRSADPTQPRERESIQRIHPGYWNEHKECTFEAWNALIHTCASRAQYLYWYIHFSSFLCHANRRDVKNGYVEYCYIICIYWYLLRQYTLVMQQRGLWKLQRR